MKNKKKDIFMCLLASLLVVLILLLIIISLSKIKVEGGCEIDKLSFDINETNNIENIILSDGKINCKFKVEAPLWIALMGV